MNTENLNKTVNILSIHNWMYSFNILKNLPKRGVLVLSLQGCIPVLGYIYIYIYKYTHRYVYWAFMYSYWSF